jgi:undecaprenyl-diphosphatase
MNAFDFSILSFFNRFVGRYPLFDGAVIFLSNDGFLRGGVIAALCWWAWFKNGEDKDKNKHAREVIISAMLACFASIIIARLAVLAFPFRTRPICDPTNGLHFPNLRTDWQNWSSFPSDHAIMFSTLTTCLFFVSPMLGWIALVDSVVLICLPRIYLGIHYPTDILAGAAIGIAVGLLANQKAFKSFLARGAFLWIQKGPGSFYAVFFLVMYQVTVIFFDLRYVAIGSMKVFLKP